MKIVHPYPLCYCILGGETSFAATERMQQQRIQKDEGTRSLNAQIQTLQVSYLILNFIFTTLTDYEVTPTAGLIILTSLFIFFSSLLFTPFFHFPYLFVIFYLNFFRHQISRDALLEEVNYLSAKNGKLEEDASSVPLLLEEARVNRGRIDVLLVLLGEKEEELEAMIGDLKDVKGLYKDQIEDLLERIVTLTSSSNSPSIAQDTMS
jgi:TATA element modulatory factor 1 TATA binding